MKSFLLENPAALQARITHLLSEKCRSESLFEEDACIRVKSSSVMVLLGSRVLENGRPPEICLILNKRSRKLKQGGDLCCPGGAINSRIDPYLARLLTFPGSPLTRWPCWPVLNSRQPSEARLLALMLATGIREGWEEIRLNPLFTRFLGPLPSQCLILFRRVIHPMVGWVSLQERFYPSWEVEKIVLIPLRSLLNPESYVRYRLHVPPHLEWRFNGKPDDFPCFVFSDGGERELLWGVTYRIVTLLVEMIFGFKPPDIASLPMLFGVLDEAYVNGG